MLVETLPENNWGDKKRWQLDSIPLNLYGHNGIATVQDDDPIERTEKAPCP
jgi:hypothetical protein